MIFKDLRKIMVHYWCMVINLTSSCQMNMDISLSPCPDTINIILGNLESGHEIGMCLHFSFPTLLISFPLWPKTCVRVQGGWGSFCVRFLSPTKHAWHYFFPLLFPVIISTILFCSMHATSTASPVNGVAAVGVNNHSASPLSSATTNATKSASEYDFSSLTKGLFSKP